MWNNVIGQEFVKNSLTQLFDKKLIPHGMLFHGDAGFGKDALALEFARILTAQNSPELNFNDNSYITYIVALPRGKNETDSDGPLDKIPAAEFEKIKNELQEKGRNPYYRINIPNANDIKINSIREIQKHLSLKLNASQRRVIIISNAELMNETSQNALLKNLEEPPENTYFILTTSKINSLRETIRSRCQAFQFSPLSESEIEEILINSFDRSQSETKIVSRICEGSYLKALELLEYDIKFFMDKTVSILRYGLAGKYHSCLKEINEATKKEDHDFELVISFIIYWLYELSFARSEKKLYYFINYEETIKKFNSKFFNVNVSNALSECEILLNKVRTSNLNINIVKFRLIMLLSSILKI